MTMDGAKRFITVLDNILNAKRKKHLVSGILLSASVCFGILALTVMTLKVEEYDEIDEEEDDDEYQVY